MASTDQHRINIQHRLHYRFDDSCLPKHYVIHRSIIQSLLFPTLGNPRTVLNTENFYMLINLHISVSHLHRTMLLAAWQCSNCCLLTKTMNSYNNENTRLLIIYSTYRNYRRQKNCNIYNDKIAWTHLECIIARISSNGEIMVLWNFNVNRY